MAIEEALVSISLVASADLSAKQYFAIEAVDTSGVAQAGLAGNGERILGVLQNDPTSGQAATIGISGVTKASAGGTIAAAADVSVDAAGEFVASATGDVIIGVNVGLTAADGDIFSLFLQPRGAAA